MLCVDVSWECQMAAVSFANILKHVALSRTTTASTNPSQQSLSDVLKPSLTKDTKES